MTDRSSELPAYSQKLNARSGSSSQPEPDAQDLKRKLMEVLQNPETSVEGDAKAAINWLTNTIARQSQNAHRENPFHFAEDDASRQSHISSPDRDDFWLKAQPGATFPQDSDFDAKLTTKEEARAQQGPGESQTSTSWSSLEAKSDGFPAKETQPQEPTRLPLNESTLPGSVLLDKAITGGRMADLSAYKDLSKAPLSYGDDDLSLPSSNSSSLGSSSESSYGGYSQHAMSPTQHFVQEVSAQEVDTEFSGNVKTLIRLVNELPEGVTKQTGAQIIRLTMEAMGISMENVLSEAQSAQSEMLDAVRANIKKIEEYKTVIRKLETDIKYYQGKANELSEIIDLFILSNTSGQKVPFPDDLSH
jgi:hypothetical protein